MQHAVVDQTCAVVPHNGADNRNVAAKRPVQRLDGYKHNRAEQDQVKVAEGDEASSGVLRSCVVRPSHAHTPVHLASYVHLVHPGLCAGCHDAIAIGREQASALHHGVCASVHLPQRKSVGGVNSKHIRDNYSCLGDNAAQIPQLLLNLGCVATSKCDTKQQRSGVSIILNR